jgi:hypothetical protein
MKDKILQTLEFAKTTAEKPSLIMKYPVIMEVSLKQRLTELSNGGEREETLSNGETFFFPIIKKGKLEKSEKPISIGTLMSSIEKMEVIPFNNIQYDEDKRHFVIK